MKVRIPVDAILQYQQGLTLSGHDQRILHAFITDTAQHTWNHHFKRQRTNWLSSMEILDSVPLALLEYMKHRKYKRCITSVEGKRAYYVDLTEPPEYHSPVVSYVTWKRQFPRVLTALTARYCGISLIEPSDQGYYPMPNLVCLPQMRELHEATVLLRQVHRDNGAELYSAHSSQYLHAVVKQMVTPTTSSRVATRRVMVVNAAIDMLGKRITENIQYTAHKDVWNYD